MGKKDKKKGKGAEKTAMKTEKKALNKMKKNLAAIGEDNLELLIAQCQEKNKISAFGEVQCEQPSPRSGFTLSAHPEKEELLLFGGEYFNGSQTTMYDDLYFYNIKKAQWSKLQTPLKPPPRCSHQAVVVGQRGGQLWVFGGEFASPSRSSFYHYRDLWVFHMRDRVWEQVKTLGGPTARSGHRMVAHKKQIVLFGGFYESLRDYRYFNDTYVFDIENYTWTKLEPVGLPPSPRSGFQMAAVSDGRILVHGGYFREKVKKDVDKGVHYADMHYLQVDERCSPPKWRWVQAKSSGIAPSPRSGLCLATAPNDLAYCFGGVHDDAADEESLVGVFHNDLYVLDLASGRWSPATLRCKSLAKRRRKDEEDGVEMAEAMQKVTVAEDGNIPTATTTYEDSVFTVKLGPSASTSASPSAPTSCEESTFSPPARMNAAAVVKNGLLYLYGGQLEDGDRQLTLSDFYALDVRKMDEWRTLVPFVPTALEWVESDSDQEMESEEEEEDSESSV